RQQALLRVAQRRMELVAELVAGTAVAFTERIAALNHEAVDHAMEDQPVVEGPGLLRAGARVRPCLAAFGKTREIGDGVRGFRVEELHGEAAERRIEMRVGAWCHLRRIPQRFSV